MIYLQLFWSFFKIGLFTFGGGYAMIPMIKTETLGHQWISEAEFINFIGISESTPGPFAINIATFVGATTAGPFGALVATFSVILPSFIIILLIAKLFRNFNKNRFVRAALDHISPIVVGLISATAILLLLNVVNLDLNNINGFDFDYITISFLAGALIVYFASKRFLKKTIHPILLIIICAIIGILVY